MYNKELSTLHNYVNQGKSYLEMKPRRLLESIVGAQNFYCQQILEDKSINLKKMDLLREKIILATKLFQAGITNRHNDQEPFMKAAALDTLKNNMQRRVISYENAVEIRSVDINNVYDGLNYLKIGQGVELNIYKREIAGNQINRLFNIKIYPSSNIRVRELSPIGSEYICPKLAELSEKGIRMMDYETPKVREYSLQIPAKNQDEMIVKVRSILKVV